jgi:hypothetical protein
MYRPVATIAWLCVHTLATSSVQRHYQHVQPSSSYTCTYRPVPYRIGMYRFIRPSQKNVYIKISEAEIANDYPLPAY